MLLLSCSTTSNKKIYSNIDNKKTKANVRLSLGVNNGICINCNKED